MDALEVLPGQMRMFGWLDPLGADAERQVALISLHADARKDLARPKSKLIQLGCRCPNMYDGSCVLEQHSLQIPNQINLRA